MHLKELIKPPIDKIIQYYDGKCNINLQGWQKIKCPFHNDSHASAGLSISEQLFVCHACNVKGNGFNIIASQEGVTFREAISIAERITGESYGSLRKDNSLRRKVSTKSRNSNRSSGRDSIRSRR